MQIAGRRSKRLCCVAAMVFSFAISSRAQESSSATKPEQEQGQGGTGAIQGPQGDEAKPVQAGSPSSPIDAQIHPAGQAVPWLGTSSPLHWGSFSVGGVTYSQVHDDFRPQGGLPSNVINLSIFRTALIFDKKFHNQEIVLQYEPQLAILNGQVGSNAGTDNALFFGTTIQLTPRLALTLKDAFAQVHSRQLFPQNFLAVDQQAGNVIQNNFLQNPGSYVMNESAAVFTYLVSPRTTLTISPAYRYSRVTNKDQGNYVANGHDYAGALAVTRALTPQQNFGITYKTEYLRATNVPNAAGTHFNTVGLFYSYQLAKSWLVKTEIGDIISQYPGGLPTTNSFGGGAALVKSFAKAAVTVAYGRGLLQQNFITGQVGDRGDILLGILVTKRLTLNGGGGYYRETGGDPRTKGSYTSSGIEFGLAEHLALFASYSHTFQSSNSPQLLSGTRNTVIFGIRWAPKPLLTH